MLMCDGAGVSDASVTVLLKRWRSGDQVALERLMESVYSDLRVIARGYLARERALEIETAELVHIAYERLVDAEIDWVDRAHFFAVAARVMRRLLIDNARARGRRKRGANAEFVTLTNVEDAQAVLRVDLIDLDDALTELAKQAPRKAQIVECFYFGGLTQQEIATALDISINTVNRDLRFARAWLVRALQGTEANGQ